MNLKNIIKEEIEDFEWIKSVEEDLIPGHSYYINSSNGIYWSPETFVGKEWDDLYGMEVYKFKDIGSDHSKHRMSADYVQTLIKQGKIKPYDPEWTILDEINFSENINDVDKGNFTIYFKDGAYLDQTIELQKILAKKVFSFPTKNLGELITSEDYEGKVQLFECINWDTTNNSYRSMSSDMRDRKKMLFSKVKPEDEVWYRSKNEEKKLQEIFTVSIDHNAIVIKGDKYLTY
jgi:hypothetical protein